MSLTFFKTLLTTRSIKKFSAKIDNFLEMGGFKQGRMDDGKPIFSKSGPKQIIKKTTPCQNFISTENSKAKLKEYFFLTKLPLPFFYV